MFIIITEITEYTISMTNNNKLFDYIFTCNVYKARELTRMPSLSGLWRDKTMAYKLMYIPNTQNYPFYWLQLEVEAFGHSTQGTNQSKFNKSFKVIKRMNFLTLI